MPLRHLRTLITAAALAALLAACGGTATDPDDPPSTDASSTPAPSETAAEEPDDFAAAVNEPRADSLYPDVGDPRVDALHYRLALDWDPETARLDGTQQLTFRATRDARRIRLDFTDALDVKRTTVDGADTDWSQPGGNRLVIHRPIEADQRYVVQLQYGGTPEPTDAPSNRADFQSGLGMHVTDRGEVWTLQEPYGAFTWYAVNDHPSDKAFYDFELTVPEPWTGIANGTLTDTATADGLRTTTWHLPHPASSYLTTVAFADYTLTEQTSASGVPISLYWLTRDESSVGEIEYAAEAMDWAEDKLGPYPFDTFGAVVVDAESAMETQTMVTLGTTAYTLSQRVFVHELVHQWYGDTVSPDDWAHVWMNEGMTMYLQLMWEAEHGPLTLEETMDNARDRVDDLVAASGPAADYDPADFGQSNIYYVPAVMWHDLRGRIGDDTFFSMLRAWPEEMAGTTSNREEHLAWVEDFTGEELDDFFEAWLFGNGT